MEPYFLVKKLLQASLILAAEDEKKSQPAPAPEAAPPAPEAPAAPPAAEAPPAEEAPPAPPAPEGEAAPEQEAPAEESEEATPADETGKGDKKAVSKKNVNYREEPEFKVPSLGYFCSTCVNFAAKSDSGQDGSCNVYGWPVKSFGICTAWKKNEDTTGWRNADGTPAQVQQVETQKK